MNRLVFLISLALQTLFLSNAKAQQMPASTANSAQVQNIQPQAKAVQTVQQVQQQQVQNVQPAQVQANQPKPVVQNIQPQVQQPVNQVAQVPQTAQVQNVEVVNQAPVQPEVKKPYVPSLTKSEKELLKNQQYSQNELKKMLEKNRLKNMAALKDDANNQKFEEKKSQKTPKKKGKNEASKLENLEKEKLTDKDQINQNSAAKTEANKSEKLENIDEEIPQNLIAVKNIFKFRGDNKTQGHYLGLDFVRTESVFYSSYDTIFEAKTEYDKKHSENFGGIGISYKYAMNYNGFFASPGVFLEKNTLDNSNNIIGSEGESMRIDGRIGITADFGYDINKFFSPYFTFGYGLVKTTQRGSYQDSNLDIYYNTKTSYSSQKIIGGGLKFSLRDDISLNLSYQKQNFIAKLRTPEESSFYLNKYSFKTKLDIYKLGIMYNF